MVKFVWLDVPEGGQVPVNPAQVKYLRQTREGATALVFGALQGGMHELVVTGDGESVTAALEASLGPTERRGDAEPQASPRRASRKRS